jgi:hypothetical protein
MSSTALVVTDQWPMCSLFMVICLFWAGTGSVVSAGRGRPGQHGRLPLRIGGALDAVLA